MSRLLLNTPPIGFVSNDGALSASAARSSRTLTKFCMSVASLWEAAIKASPGKVTLAAVSVQASFEEQMLASPENPAALRPLLDVRGHHAPPPRAFYIMPSRRTPSTSRPPPAGSNTSTATS